MKLIAFITPRLSVAMPLLLGLAAIAAAPSVGAVTVNEVDIILGGFVDVDEDGDVDAADDLANVALWCGDAAPIRVDILNGKFDVNESGSVSTPGTSDDLLDCDLNNENSGIPTPDQVDICDGLVEVNEGVCPADATDNATNINLFVLP